MSSVAIPNGASARPGFFRVLWELIVGYLFTFFAILLPLFGLVYLGVFDWNAPSFRDWPLRGPYPPDGVWAISSDVFCAVVVIAVSTVIVSGSMEAGLKLPVSRWIVGSIAAATGVAPFFYAQLLPASAPVGLLAATFLIRKFAIGRSEQVSVRRSRWLSAAVVAGGVVGIVVTASFGVLHPLWAKDAYVSGNSVQFSLHNAGLARVNLLGLSRPARLAFPLTPSHGRPRVEGIGIPAHASRPIVLLDAGCAARDLTLRYRVFGRTMSAHVRVAPPNSTAGISYSRC